MTLGGELQLVEQEKPCIILQKRWLHWISSTIFQLGEPPYGGSMCGNDPIRLSLKLEIFLVRSSAKFSKGSKNIPRTPREPWVAWPHSQWLKTCVGANEALLWLLGWICTPIQDYAMCPWITLRGELQLDVKEKWCLRSWNFWLHCILDTKFQLGVPPYC